ncbi:reverse transcriptase domain-containing protein, partial [Tanacetum coccineum]
MGKGLTMPTDPHHTPIITQPSSFQPQRKQRSRRPKRKDTEISQSSVPSDYVVDEAVNEKMDDGLVRAATTATSLDVEQDKGDTIAQTRFENVSMKLKELMELCTNLQNRVIDLENTKTAQAQEITSLKLRVKRLEKKEGSRTYKLKRLYKVYRSARIVSSNEASLGDQEDASKQERKINDIDADAGINLLLLIRRMLAKSKVSVADTLVSAATTTATTTATKTIADEVEMTLAQTLIEIKSIKPKAKGIVMQDPTRKKHFSAIKAKEKRNKPPTKAQKRNTMSTYLKNIAGYKSNQLKNKSFDDIQKLFNKAMKRVNTFVDMDTELVKESSKKANAVMAQKSSSKRAGDELEQESIKKQK